MATINTYFVTHVKKLCSELFFYKHDDGNVYMLAMDDLGKRLFVSAPLKIEAGNFSVSTRDIKLTAKRSKCLLSVYPDSVRFDDGPIVSTSSESQDTLVELFQQTIARTWNPTTGEKDIDGKLFSTTNKACKNIEFLQDDLQSVTMYPVRFRLGARRLPGVPSEKYIKTSSRLPKTGKNGA